ncbi:MAG TPA: ATP-binding protein [Vicinamibacterales bacterium]|nr:ATP-binding protein [Vicinamibacterales bacterium]
MAVAKDAVRPTLPARKMPAQPKTADRRPLRDNPRLILLGIVLLIGALVAMIVLADQSRDFSPDFLTEVLLYALSAADLTMVLALVFVLARNIIKLLVERRRGLPFSRFRAKLVLAMLGLTIIPSVLVLLVGGELIRQTTARWFADPIDDVLKSANAIAVDYYAERQAVAAGHAARLAGTLPAAALRAGDVAAIRSAIEGDVRQGRVGLVEVYQVRGKAAPAPIVAVESPSLPRGHVRASADRLAARVASGSSDVTTHDPLTGGGELVRAGALVRDASSGAPVGVVIASDHLSGSLAQHSRRISEAYEGYTQLRVMKPALEGVYLSVFLMMTLMILVSATWMGLYLAKRITRPVQLLAAGAREIGAGRLDHRIEPETRDEFGSLVEAFNTMAGELATSQRKLERSRVDLERKNTEVDERRRYIETVLERIATGVVSIGADRRVETVNSAALRLLGLEGAVIGRGAEEVFEREDLRPLQEMVRRAQEGRSGPAGQEIALAREGRELHLAAAATQFQTDGETPGGVVLVFDDVTPLIRTQRVAAWRDVARRLAHEIKNPLTPIQLSAERLRRQFATAPPTARALIDECTTTIVTEVDSLKALVDEFAQFARMPAPKTVPSDLNAVLVETLSLYSGLFKNIALARRLAPGLPLVRIDPEQMRRVIINLMDNAVEALGGASVVPGDGDLPTIELATEHDGANAVVRVTVSDNGPGIPPEDRDKLFMPYYSTKRRGSGLGLAIVRRIVAEHGGAIDVADNTPTGTVFTIELPC